MKALFRTVICVLLCMLTLGAGLIPSFNAESFYQKAEMLQMKSHMEKDAGLSQYGVVQGACASDKYAFFAAMNGGATILKYDLNTWLLVGKETISDVGHGNDMAYNSDENILVIANNAPYYNTVTIVDADTLKAVRNVELKHKVKVKEKDKKTGKEVEKEVEKPLDIYSIAYNSELKQYVVGISGGYDFALLDSDFKKLKTFKGVNTGYTRQGCDCDKDHIYFVQSGGGNNLLVIYDYSGNLVSTVTINHAHEIENIFHIGNAFYTSLFYYGNTLHRIGFSDTTKITFRVAYDPNGGEGTMEPTVVHYGTGTKLRKNAFTREGYSFGGWIVERSDGKLVGYAVGADDYEWLDKDKLYNYYLYTDEAKIAKTVKNGTVKLSAFWIADYYDIYFDCGDGEGYMEPTFAGYDETVKIPENQFTKEGYVFEGYVASRDVDGRVYGFRKDSSKPEWLEPGDMASPAFFMPGDEMSRMTYDGSVTLTASFKYAYTFDSDGSTLTEYVGVDEVVNIPDNDGELSTLAEGAFKDNEVMTDLYIPASVNSIEHGSISDCSNLKGIYFEGELPQNLDSSSVSTKKPPVLYRVYDGKPFCIGIFADPECLPLIRCQAEVLDKRHAAH